VAIKKKTKTKSLVIHQLLAPYLSDLQALNRSPKTIEHYQYTLVSFIAFLENNKLPLDISKISQDHVFLYIQHLQQHERWQNKPGISRRNGNLSPFSIQGQIRDLKAFSTWVARKAYINRNTLAGMPLPKVPYLVIHTLTQNQLSKLLSAIDKLSAIGQKYFCLFVMLLDTGLRVSEAIGIKLRDVDLGARYIKVIGKGRRERIVTFSKLTGKTLLNYIDGFRHELGASNNPYLFPTGTRHVSANSVQQYLRRLAEKAGLQGVRIYPHLFRHTCATELINNGANVFMVKDLLGHSSLLTTLKYTHLQPEDLRREQSKYSPVEKLLKIQNNYFVE